MSTLAFCKHDVAIVSSGDSGTLGIPGQGEDDGLGGGSSCTLVVSEPLALAKNVT
jgi:hypothetical protein